VSHPQLAKGVPLRTFQEEITTLQRMVILWGLCHTGDMKELAKRVIWIGEDQVEYREPEFKQDLTPYLQDEWLPKLVKGDVLLPALVYLQTVINKHLEWRVAPKLLWNRRAGVLDLHVQPTSLQGMLWLQFAGDVKGKTAYRTCLVCGRWICVGLDEGRTRRQYCSSACRTRALRKRQDKVRRLYLSGQSIHQIADHLKIDEASVEKWVYFGAEEED
jgi:hypothetical protein